MLTCVTAPKFIRAAATAGRAQIALPVVVPEFLVSNHAFAFVQYCFDVYERSTLRHVE